VHPKIFKAEGWIAVVFELYMQQEGVWSDFREGREWRMHVGKVSSRSMVQNNLSILVSVDISCSLLHVKQAAIESNLL
jgi:hypothetical protein